MAHRVNVMVDDRVWEALKAVPAGERSRLINIAVSNEILVRRRLLVAAQMDQLREHGRHSGKSAEALLRVDRDSHK